MYSRLNLTYPRDSTSFTITNTTTVYFSLLYVVNIFAVDPVTESRISLGNLVDAVGPTKNYSSIRLIRPKNNINFVMAPTFYNSAYRSNIYLMYTILPSSTFDGNIPDYSEFNVSSLKRLPESVIRNPAVGLIFNYSIYDSYKEGLHYDGNLTTTYPNHIKIDSHMETAIDPGLLRKVIKKIDYRIIDLTS